MKLADGRMKSSLNTCLYFTLCFIINYFVIRWNIQINFLLYIFNILFFVGIYIKYKYINALKAIFIIFMLILGNYAIMNQLKLSFASMFATLILFLIIRMIYTNMKVLLKNETIILGIPYAFLIILLFVYTNNTLYLLTLLFSSFYYSIWLNKIAPGESTHL